MAQDLKADGFREAGTVHAARFALTNGRTSWNRRTVVVVDEAAMLDSRVTGELLTEAKSAGAKVILAGDDRQLASIERGGLLTELRKAHGAAETTKVTRQKVDWQRQAARDLAEGRFDSAVHCEAAFAVRGRVQFAGLPQGNQSAVCSERPCPGGGPRRRHGPWSRRLFPPYQHRAAKRSCCTCRTKNRGP